MLLLVSDPNINPPPQRRRRALLGAVIAAAATCGVVWAAYPLADATARLHAIPLHGPDFASRDLTLTAAEREILGRVDLVHRLYRISTQDVYATIIDGT